MKKVFFVIVILLVFCFSAAFAHPPVDITITFNPQTKILKAVVLHPTSSPQTHYIKKVDVAVNGTEIVEQKISRQDNNETQTVSYLIPDSKTGDVISVEAYCSISGTLAKEIKISGK